MTDNKTRTFTSDELLHIIRNGMIDSMPGVTHPLRDSEFIFDNWEIFNGPEIEFKIDTLGLQKLRPTECNFRDFGMDHFDCRTMYKSLDDAFGVDIMWEINPCGLTRQTLPHTGGKIIYTLFEKFFDKVSKGLGDRFVGNLTRNSPDEEPREKITNIPISQMGDNHSSTQPDQSSGKEFTGRTGQRRQIESSPRPGPADERRAANGGSLQQE